MNLQMSDLWTIIKRRMPLIALATVVAVAATGLISFFVLKPQYEATTTLLVQPINLSEEITYNNLIANEKLVTTYTEIIKSRFVIKAEPVTIIGRTILGKTSFFMLLALSMKTVKQRLSISVKSDQPTIPAIK